MGLADDVEASDAAALMDPDLGGVESVIYHPYAGSDQTMYARVLRKQPVDLGDQHGARGVQISVMIPIGAAPSGRPSINTTKDRITLAKRKGGATEKFSVNDVIGQDGGMWTLAVG